MFVMVTKIVKKRIRLVYNILNVLDIVLTKFYQNDVIRSIPYWHNTVTISLVYDTSEYIPRDSLHPITLRCKLKSALRKFQRD